MVLDEISLKELFTACLSLNEGKSAEALHSPFLGKFFSVPASSEFTIPSITAIETAPGLPQGLVGEISTITNCLD